MRWNRTSRLCSDAAVAWIEASDVITMFPTLVWKMQLERERHEAIDSAIIATLVTMRENLPKLAPGEGWQSAQNLHEHEALRDLVACIEKASQSVLRFLKIGCDAFEITGCWANVLARGAAHKAHGHPNNFLSGVYYLRTPPGSDTINFHDPRVQAGIIRPPVTELTAANTDQVAVSVKSGTLLIFPSYLQHSVDRNESDQERISVSFNYAR